jgi:hypothetical protein|mmetsp:Transcript_16704/g.26861  ORF Transcript_16704/g.26861 Transcript_16704/m.26861 type:complete len:91 (+) Transcript_16704:140-412(+)
MHRIASLGDVQESNKKSSRERDRFTDDGDEDEQRAALVDFGRVFETVLKHTVVAAVTTTWQAVAGLYYVVRDSDYDSLWGATCELYHGDP